MESILKLKNYNVTYLNKKENKKVYAVKNASFEIYKGDSLGIVGESGSGKSTLAMGILNLLPQNSSEIEGEANFIGNDLTKLSEKEYKDLRWSELSVVFQKSMNSLSPVHRIGTQVEDIYRVHKKNSTNKEIFERFSYLLNLVNLPESVYKSYPHQLSGGMLQRVSIALSIIHNPKLLILDEATTALDVVTQGQILEEIVKMEKEMDMTRIMITHDVSVVAASCNKIAVMYAGEFMEIGKVEDVLKNPKHPYTKGLMVSFPSLRGKKEKIEAIEGFLPDLTKKYQGCIFEPRCSKSMKICKEVKPEIIRLKDGRYISCHLYGGGKNE